MRITSFLEWRDFQGSGGMYETLPTNGIQSLLLISRGLVLHV